ncbi:MAG: hypothetical protein Q7T44_00095 [Parvibaculum sp.]|nr:hypothetical protein [Parvibaculum sp.]
MQTRFRVNMATAAVDSNCSEPKIISFRLAVGIWSNPTNMATLEPFRSVTGVDRVNIAKHSQASKGALS